MRIFWVVLSFPSDRSIFSTFCQRVLKTLRSLRKREKTPQILTNLMRKRLTRKHQSSWPVTVPVRGESPGLSAPNRAIWCDCDLKGSALRFCCGLKKGFKSQIARFELRFEAFFDSDLGDILAIWGPVPSCKSMFALFYCIFRAGELLRSSFVTCPLCRLIVFSPFQKPNWGTFFKSQIEAPNQSKGHF